MSTGDGSGRPAGGSVVLGLPVSADRAPLAVTGAQYCRDVESASNDDDEDELGLLA